MQTLYVNDPVAARRRVRLWIVGTDGVTPATGEATGQPTYSVNGTTVGNTGGTLVAIDSAKGLYYVEMSQANLAGLNPGDTLWVCYKDTDTLVAESKCELALLPWLDQGTAQAGAAGSITLQAGASAVDDFYRDCVVQVYAGTGAGQVREVSGYVGGTKVATVTVDWTTAPDNTSRYVVLPAPRLLALASEPTVAEIAADADAARVAAEAVQADVANGVTIDGVALSAIADAILARNLEGGSSGGTFTVGAAFAACRNRTVPNSDGSQLIVYHTDGTTPWYALAITRLTPGIAPITGVTPAGSVIP